MTKEYLRPIFVCGKQVKTAPTLTCFGVNRSGSDSTFASLFNSFSKHVACSWTFPTHHSFLGLGHSVTEIDCKQTPEVIQGKKINTFSTPSVFLNSQSLQVNLFTVQPDTYIGTSTLNGAYPYVIEGNIWCSYAQ